MAIKTFTVNVRKGERPEEWTGTDWWTPEQWAAFNKYVEELKAKGEYLQEEEYTISYDDSMDKTWNYPKKEPEEYFSNFGFFVPNGNAEKKSDKILPPLSYKK